MATVWTDDVLDQARGQGDDLADGLAAKVMAHEHGIRRCGHFLDVADALVRAPELMLAGGSELREHYDHITREDPALAAYYQPVEAPAWVDEEKLRLAASVWEENTLAVIAVLYASSLPSCYLMRHGVPVLYRSAKLAEHDYVYQRIYETGLMLDRVMEPGGLRVVADYEAEPHLLLAEVLNELDPRGGWEARGPRVSRAAGGEVPSAELRARVQAEFARRLVRRRYLWGPGYLAARKVRFLHASIRFILRHPQHVVPQVQDPAQARTLTEALTRLEQPWDEKELRVPINQEDMAFVLLTFGYLIPLGLERWGCPLEHGRKEAFLHLWRVIGHVMGIREDLMTDRWDEAAALHGRILSRQAGASETGQALTRAVMGFLRDYLPARFGLRERLPAQLIVSQLGDERAQQVLPEDGYRAARAFLPWTAFRAGLLAVRVYFALSSMLEKVPALGSFLVRRLHESADELVSSWRDAFARRPFEVSKEAVWVRSRGATPAFLDRLRRWRHRLFDVYALAIGVLGAAGIALFGTLVTLLDLDPRGSGRWAVATVALALLSAAILKWWLDSVFRARPRLAAPDEATD